MRFLRALIAWRTRMPQSWLRATSSRVRPAGATCGATRSARSSSLDVLDDVADSLEAIGTDPHILTDIETFRECVGDHKDAVHDLGKRLEGGQITPAQALEELDQITNDARTRIAELIEATLATDASSQGRARYARWKGAGISLTAANAEYDGAYWSEDADTDVEYNPAATIRLIANSAGVDLNGLPAPADRCSDGWPLIHLSAADVS